MKAEIIAVGNEVITGHTINTNAAYIAQELQKYGILTEYHSAVGDCKEDIQEALKLASIRSQFVFLIGGLGPTDDDLTKEETCSFLADDLLFDVEIYKEIEAYFAKTGRQTPLNNRKQAMFPKGAHILKNHNGTAPGCILEKKGVFYILLPGPPKELIPMFEDVMRWLKPFQKEAFLTLDIKCFGLGESQIAETLQDVLGVYEDAVVATYVGNMEVTIRIRVMKPNLEEAQKKVAFIKKQIQQRLEPYIIGYNQEKIEENILSLLKQKQFTVATAESCTGGMLSSTLVGCSGISQYFKEGIVTYSNEAKMKYLEVRDSTLRQYGAVSYETAREMAIGIKKASGAHIGLSTTGIAGPDGGTKEKPVGLVYIGIAIGDDVFAYELKLQGNRQEVRERAVKHVLYELYKKLK